MRARQSPYFPKRIILVRHGESTGNVDESEFERMPDWKFSLSATGVQQARAAGERLRDIVGNERVKFFCSPYVRCTQTMTLMAASLADDQWTWAEEPRLREQEFGNLQTAVSARSARSRPRRAPDAHVRPASPRW